MWPIRRYGAIPVLLCASLLLVAARPGAASQESKRLSSKGLIDFHAERYAAALTLFDQAVQADPTDPHALYYRGVTRGRLGQYDGAAADLQAALDQDPSLTQARLELGVALVQGSEYRAAIPWLTEAQRETALDGRASLFLGIAQLRLGRLDSADDNFARAAARDPAVRMPARYYEGVIAYEDGRWADARGHFTYVRTYAPTSAMGREATEFMKRIEGQAQPRGEVYGSVGFQYDSNVVLSTDAIQISNKADGRAVFSLGGFYSPLQTEEMQLTGGYEFFQSLHFDLTDYDLQDHRGNLQWSGMWGPFYGGLQSRYDYYLLKTSSFLQEVNGGPWAGIEEEDFGRTEVLYGARWRDYKKRAYSPTRDAWNNAAGLRQYFYLGSRFRYLQLGYQFNHESPQHSAGDPFEYDGHEVGSTLAWAFPMWATDAQLGVGYRRENYDASASDGRDDNQYLISASASRQLNEFLMLTVGYLGDINDSNKSDFSYDRHIGSVALEARFN
jgi:tetratricopeptide (TPR) repeat protein